MIKRITLASVTALCTCILVSCNQKNGGISPQEIKKAEKIIGISFNPVERDSMADGLNKNLEDYTAIREFHLDNSVFPKLVFDPRPINFSMDTSSVKIDWDSPAGVERPDNLESLAFYPVSALSSLIKMKKVSSMELTRMYLNRLHRYNDTLKCVVTFTDTLAYQQAKKADEELAIGIYRGPLHGIPYGVKDLFAVKGYKTTWGAYPYKDQTIDYTAAVVKKLENAGAVLIAKLSLGELAKGDLWFEGRTKNPWDLSQGSSGSSAGSASATSAGLVAFSIGTETWGSIVSPSARCGITGLRPTFGRVSRDGAMALSWTLDKVGPICRNANDCALVFDAIRGKDKNDQATVQYPFNYNPKASIKNLKIGYFKALFEGEKYRERENDSLALLMIKNMGATLHELKFPDSLPIEPLRIIFGAEAAAAFDELTRNNEDDRLVEQTKNSRPNFLRKSRFIPAVEYIQANRVRQLLIEQFNKEISGYDVIISPTFVGDQLLLTNLTGHPCVVVPHGFDNKNRPTSITFIGNLYDEATILGFAKLFQEYSGYKDLVPGPFKLNTENQ